MPIDRIGISFILKDKECPRVGTYDTEIVYLPPILEYSPPLKYPLTGAVAAYTNIAVLNIEPRLKVKCNR